jgi:superfamily II DNA/RNA helicase
MSLSTVQQFRITIAAEKDKIDALCRVISLGRGNCARILVYCRSSSTVEQVAEALVLSGGCRVDAVTDDDDAEAAATAASNFLRMTREPRVLVCTAPLPAFIDDDRDGAGRGRGGSLVVCFDIPTDFDGYLERVGCPTTNQRYQRQRTAVAVCFATPGDAAHLRELEAHFGCTGQWSSSDAAHLRELEAHFGCTGQWSPQVLRRLVGHSDVSTLCGLLQQ